MSVMDWIFTGIVILLAVVGLGVYRWWDKIAPVGRSQQVSVNPQAVNAALDAATGSLLEWPGSGTTRVITESAAEEVADARALIEREMVGVWGAREPLMAVDIGDGRTWLEAK